MKIKWMIILLVCIIYKNDVLGECGSCFGAGAERECCNTCEQLIDAYRRKQWNVDRIIRSSPQV